MRTIIDLDPDMFRRAEERAREEGIPVRDLIETALRSYLHPAKSRGDYRLQWRTEKGELLPGVDLDSRLALFDRMSDGN